MDMIARIPSPAAPKSPTNRASVSLFNCLEVVPEEISPWKPEIAPHAIVINNSGNQETPATACVAGADTVGFVTNSPKSRIAKPTTARRASLKPLDCNTLHPGHVEALYKH